MKESEVEIKENPEKGEPNEVTYRSFIRLFLMVVNLGWGSFYFGYGVVYFGTFEFETIASIYSIQMDLDVAQGLLQGCIPIGAGVGALTSFILLKIFSRRNLLLVINAFAFVVTGLLLIPNAGLLFFCRICQGLCVGFYSAVIPLIIKQFSPIQISGILGAMSSLFVTLGVYFMCLLQFILLEYSQAQNHWRYVFGFPLITIFLQTILLLTVYNFETPRYLLQQDREQDCMDVLEYIYKQKYVEVVFEQKKNQIHRHQEEVKTEMQHPEKFKVNKIRVALAVHLAVLQQFSGINAVVGYGSSIVSDVLPRYASAIPVILNFEQVLTCLITAFLVERFGRKNLLQFGTIGASIFLLLIAVGFFIQSDTDNTGNVMIIAGLVFYMLFYGLSLGPVVWLYIPEIVEPKIIPFSTLANWVSASIVMILFPILGSAIGSIGPLFLFFCIWCVMSFFVNWKFMVESKNKTQNQIFAEFDK